MFHIDLAGKKLEKFLSCGNPAILDNVEWKDIEDPHISGVLPVVLYLDPIKNSQGACRGIVMIPKSSAEPVISAGVCCGPEQFDYFKRFEGTKRWYKVPISELVRVVTPKYLFIESLAKEGLWVGD